MEAKNKHIVILTPGFPENETDTTCIPALQIYFKALREISGYEITVITFHYPNKKVTYNWNKIPVYALNGGSSFSKILLWKQVFQTLKQIHRGNSITILHSFWLGECAFVGHSFSRKNHIKHLTTLMGQDVLKGNLYSKILPLKRMQLVTLSDFHQEKFYKNYKTQTIIIPWGINSENFLNSTDKTIDIIGVGSLIPLKNYELFIDIIYQINQKKPIKVVLIGDGVLKEKLEEKIRFLQLEKVIDLKGKLDYSDTLKCISQARILLHTSNYESFGLVFSEALQSKTMIVSRSIGCAFSSPNWEVCNDKAQMIAACENLLSKPFDDTQKNPFRIEKTVENYLEIYDK